MLVFAENQEARLPPQLQTAALQIARFRGALDWMLAHPLWEDDFVCMLSELNLKGPRQGISATGALRSLPLEHKTRLVQHALEAGLARPPYRDAKRLARLWGSTSYRSRKDMGTPSYEEWGSLQQTTLLRLAARYQTYKISQSELFSSQSELPSACVSRLCTSASDHKDACQEARLALLEAIDRIDPEEKNFVAYARQWIKRRVQNFLMQEQLPVRTPINLLSKTLRSRPDGSAELAKAIRQGIVRLDNPLCPDAESATGQILSDDQEPAEAAARADDSNLLDEALAALTNKQREVIELRFGLRNGTAPLSLASIGKQSGITRQQVFQREKRGLQALQRRLLPLRKERGDSPRQLACNQELPFRAKSVPT